MNLTLVRTVFSRDLLKDFHLPLGNYLQHPKTSNTSSQPLIKLPISRLQEVATTFGQRALLQSGNFDTSCPHSGHFTFTLTEIRYELPAFTSPTAACIFVLTPSGLARPSLTLQLLLSRLSTPFSNALRPFFIDYLLLKGFVTP